MAEVHSRCTRCERKLIRIYDPEQVKEWEKRIQGAPEKLNGWKVLDGDLVQIHHQSPKFIEIWTTDEKILTKGNGSRSLCPDHMKEYLKEKGIV